MFAAPVALALALAGSAQAAEPEFAGTDDPTQEFDEPETDLSAEAGYAMASGNVEYWLLSSAVNGGHRWQKNKLGLVLGANVGRSRVDQAGDGFLGPDDRAIDMAETTRRYAGDLRYDRFIGEKSSLYALVGAFVDPFAGYDLRSHEQVGYSRILADSDSVHLVAEVGVDYAQENYMDDLGEDNQQIIAARVMVGAAWTVNENAKLEETIEVYENVLDASDVRVLNTIGLSAKLSDVFSLKLSHSLSFDNVPPGFDPDIETYSDLELRRLDQITTATLVASVF